MKLLSSLALILVAANSAQGQCPDWCGGDIANVDTTKSLDLTSVGEGTQGCGTIFAATSTALNATECAAIKPFENVCCPSKGTRECFLCGDSAKAFNASKGFGEGITCGALDALFTIASKAQCDAGKKPFEGMYDVAAYCECEGVPPPNKCNPCGDGQEIDPSGSFTAVDDETNKTETISCGMAAEAIKYITNTTVCDGLLKTIPKSATDACCKAAASSGMTLSISSLATALVVGLASFAI